MEENAFIIVGYVIFAIGIAGLLFPLIPGAPIIFGGAFIVAWASNYQALGMTGLVTIGILATLTFLIDFVSSMLGAKRVGASSLALWGATIGGIVGLAGGFIGIVFGPFVGGFLGELYASKDLRKAGKVGLGTWIGMALGAICKICLGIIMILTIIFG